MVLSSNCVLVTHMLSGFQTCQEKIPIFPVARRLTIFGSFMWTDYDISDGHWTQRTFPALTSDSGSWIRSLPSQTRKQHGVQQQRRRQLRQAADCTAETEDNCRAFTETGGRWLDRASRGVQSPGEQDRCLQWGEDGAEEEVQGCDGAVDKGPSSLALASH